MDFFEKITENLVLQTIIENNWKDNELIAVGCYFSFFGKDCSAYVSTKRLENDYPSYGLIESNSAELHESFKDLLQSEDVWNKLKEKINHFISDEWQPNNRAD